MKYQAPFIPDTDVITDNIAFQTAANNNNNKDGKLNMVLAFDYLGLGLQIDFATDGLVQAGTDNKYFNLAGSPDYFKWWVI